MTLSLLITQSNYAQINEIGVFGGGSNFIGDVGPTKFIAPNTPSIGLIYKWNRSKRHSYRVTVIYSDLKSKDMKSNDPRRIQRDYFLDSNLLEISTGIEFTFKDFDLHTGEITGTPYLFSGIAATRYSLSHFKNGLQVHEGGKDWTVGIPMVLGYKTNILGDFIIGFEIGARYTFTDNIDGSFPQDSNYQQYQYGNTNNNDWYTFTGFTLTYTFGIKPCYCHN